MTHSRMHTGLSIMALAATLVVSTWALQRVGVVDMTTARAAYAEYSASSRIDEHFALHAVRKLQIGTGPNDLEGWLNTDIEPRAGQVFLDASKPFPMPDSSVHYIYAEQVIEHIPFAGGMVMLRESHRVLAPGGVLRVATPNLERLLALFDHEKTIDEQRFMDAQLKMVGLTVHEPERPLFILNTYFHDWGHRFLYDQQTLKSAAETAGFRDVSFKRHGESDHAALKNVERHIDVIGRDIDEYVTMIVEAKK